MNANSADPPPPTNLGAEKKKKKSRYRPKDIDLTKRPYKYNIKRSSYLKRMYKNLVVDQTLLLKYPKSGIRFY